MLPIVVALLLAAIAAANQDAYPSCFANFANIDHTIALAVDNLDALGYDVTYGYMGFQNFCLEDSPTCWGQNPSSPYGRYMMATSLLPTVYDPIWQLRPDEALIFYGCTPPQSRYFGLQSYAFISKSRMLFADMTDSINNYVVNTSQPSFPFDTEVFFVTSGDQQAAADAQTAFRDTGVSQSVMNVDVIPNTDELGLDPMGVGLNNTIFATLYRIAECANTTLCNQYYTQNWDIIRATPKKQRQGVPFPVPPYKNRTTAYNENYLNQTLMNLVDSVIKHQAVSVKLSSSDKLLPFTWSGRECISADLNCVGDTRDACYMDGDVELGPLPRPSSSHHSHHVSMMHPEHVPEGFEHVFNQDIRIQPNGPQYYLTNDTNDFIIVVGVIHSQTPNPLATYTNLAVYNVDKDMGVFAVMDTGLTGSAQQYGQAAKDFYAFKFARNCATNEQFCYSVPTTFPGVPLELPLSFVERAYVNPHTTVGPDPAQILSPYILHFVSRF